MSFVRGYARDLGWVKAHRRRPNRAEGGQLPLPANASGEAAEEGSAEPDPTSPAGAGAADAAPPGPAEVRPVRRRSARR